MSMHKFIISGGILVAGIVIVIAATQSFGAFTAQKHNSKKSEVTGDMGSQKFSDAAFAFGITELSRSGNTVTFTIPKNAHALEKKADAVVLSGLYDTSKQKPDECPVVQSTAVSKTVEDYNPISGKAHVKALFDDEELAKSALEKGCLLINDPKN